VSSYPFGKIRPPGTAREHSELVGKEVDVLEKIDGSQFSFWIEEGRVRSRSRGKMLDPTCGNLFSKAWAYATTLEDRLSSRLVYRAESVSRPKHNVIAYERAPETGMVLWGAEEKSTGNRVSYGELCAIGEDLGIEVVPRIARVLYTGPSCLDEYAEGPSMLGGFREGVVASHGTVYTKVVTDRFREVAKSPRKKRARTRGEVAEAIGETLARIPRWEKAVQRLLETGDLTKSPRDIGPLLRSIHADIEEEEGAYIRERLYVAFRKTVLKRACRDFPTWYQRTRLVEILKEEEDG
jgi:hypothetical protein